jgi:hypothetical protein
MKAHKIDRLLRSASQTPVDDVPPEMPFGFDTRVVALWRASVQKPNGLASLLQRVALLSVAVIAISTLAAVLEIKQSQEKYNDFANEFAIADTAIQDEFSQ